MKKNKVATHFLTERSRQECRGSGTRTINFLPSILFFILREVYLYNATLLGIIKIYYFSSLKPANNFLLYSIKKKIYLAFLWFSHEKNVIYIRIFFTHFFLLFANPFHSCWQVLVCMELGSTAEQSTLQTDRDITSINFVYL